jgi:membrane-bound lytic murein transglycosylase D
MSAACARTSIPSQSPTPARSPEPSAPVAIQQATPVPLKPAPVTPDATAASATLASVSASAAKPDSLKILTTDVVREAIGVFGDSALPPDSSAEPSWDIDVHSYESTSRVEHYVRLFTGSARERIEARLVAGTRYEPMIRAAMRDGGIPEDMYYLALVESGFDPNAYSRAAAVGMWQFMTSTARDMGMRVDWWVDERRDPVKSTAAAVRFIKGLREQFGSLYLAAAAYNGGPVRIARGLRRYADDLEGTTGDDLFFALAEKDYLRNETREYVPQLIAAALIAKDPERYGLKINKLSPYSYDSVRVGPSTPVAAIAHAADEKPSVIQELNPQILRGMTPPRDSFFVRLPEGKADSFAVAFAALPEAERIAYRKVESKKGESVATIAKRAGLASKLVTAFNPNLTTLKSGNLAPGQIVLVPTAAVASAATLAPDPAIERYSSSRYSSTHVVKSGETLGSVAKKYHMTTAALMRANGLRRAVIFPGQSLVVGKPSAPKKSTSNSSSAGSKASSKKASTKKTGAAKSSARS